MKYLCVLTTLFLTLILSSCWQISAQQSSLQTQIENPEYDQKFNEYWFSGLAEVSNYKLEQARYGEIREGNAVIIFVTEPFSSSKQVKLDDPVSDNTDKVDVLKMNFTKDFNTGIYPYSTMTSVYTPIQQGNLSSPLKINTSCTEWCGQSFAQLNQTKNDFRLQQFSYFEKEGDKDKTIKKNLTEDEIWNTVRLSPNLLPIGDFKVIPSLQYLRFSHEECQAFDAKAEITYMNGMMIYSLTYTHNKRKLSIHFRDTFPFTIEKWEEIYMDGWGDNAKMLTTKGTLIKRINLDYWTKNLNSNAPLRIELGLD